MAIPTVSTCSICGETKNRQAFRWNPRFGLRTECKQCEETQLRCSKCNEVKPHDGFPPCKTSSTGRHAWCHACKAALENDKYHNDPEAYAKHKEYERSAAGRAVQKKSREQPKTKEYRRKYQREYGPKRYSDPVNRVKHQARMAVRHAVQSGKLTKALSCQCGGKYDTVCNGPIEAHHHKGYAPEHWLDVEWLAKNCHLAADAKLKQQES